MKFSRLLQAKQIVPLTPKIPFELYTAGRTDLAPLPTTAEVDKDGLLANLKMMYKIRSMETWCDQSYKDKKIRGFCHLYIGQEAICVGMENVLNYEDSIVTGYRDHGWHLTRGGTPLEVFAEMFAKQAGCSKGKGGSMHMYNVKNKFFGGNGIVGAQVPIGAGLAWKYSLTNGKDSPKNVAVTLYGDGAANQGQIFEALNIAALQRIPVILVCENNHFGMGTSEARGSAFTKFFERGQYVPGIKVDGMDLLAVQEGTRYAKEYCLSGKGPIVMEMDTYRYMGHSMSDPDVSYRKKDDIATVKSKRDCISKLASLIESLGLANEAELKALERKAKSEVVADLAAAEAAAGTSDAELTTDIIHGEQTDVRSCQGTVWLKA